MPNHKLLFMLVFLIVNIVSVKELDTFLYIKQPDVSEVVKMNVKLSSKALSFEVTFQDRVEKTD